MKLIVFIVFMACGVSMTLAACSSNLISSGNLVGSFPKSKILGPLGHPLGEYMTIEGRPCVVGFGGRVNFESIADISKFGVHSLEVHKVDGVELKKPIIISFIENAKFTPASNYIMRGYQTGEFGPGNPDPKDPTATTPQFDYQFWIRFVPTRDLTHDKEAKTNKDPLTSND